MSATSVPCAEWGSSRYVRTESAFLLQSCLAAPKTGALTWHTVEIVPIQREPVPVREDWREAAVYGVIGFCVIVLLARLVSR